VRCEVVAIGTELLLGIITDTNSSWIGEQLALNGIDSYFQVKVGDNFERIEACLRTALERSDAVICCGGLGPTQDDITRDVIAAVMGAPMQRNETIAAELQRRFAARGQTMPQNNLRQAEVPVGARIMTEMPGTAPGLVCPMGDKVIYAVPGVPSEMRAMVEGTVLPDLRVRAGVNSVIRSRVLRIWGVSESRLAELLQERIEDLDRTRNATLAFQASGIEGIKVRITAKADTEAHAMAELEAQDRQIRPILGDAIFGVDDETIELAVIKSMQQKGLTLAATETLTGGLLSSRLTQAEPHMQTFLGSSIISARQLLDDFGKMEMEMRALALAKQARTNHQADVGIAAIEPFSADAQPPGTVILAIAATDFEHTGAMTFSPDRERMREFSAISLLNELRKTLLANRS